MSFFQRFFGSGASARPGETKSAPVQSWAALHQMGQARWAPRNYAAFAREGYAANPIGYRCVRMISEAAASAPWLLYQDDAELNAHPLLELLTRPNPLQSGQALMEQFYAHLQVAGNAYLEAASIDEAPRALHALRPDRMRVVSGADGWPESYEYEVDGRPVRFRQNVETGIAPILHLKLHNPLDDHYGLSPFEAAAKAIDIHSSASNWNKALLDNAAKPSGALVFKGEGEATLTQEQFDRLKHELDTSFQGSINAGRPMILEGGLDWKPLSHSPRDMEHIEAKHVAAREIALAFGVPPMLLGIPGDNTFSNYAEANRAFWRQTVLPLITRTAQALTCWLQPAYGGMLRLGFDLDAVDALSSDREALWRRVNEATFLSEDEKREAVGYGARTDAAVI